MLPEFAIVCVAASHLGQGNRAIAGVPGILPLPNPLPHAGEGVSLHFRHYYLEYSLSRLREKAGEREVARLNDWALAHLVEKQAFVGEVHATCLGNSLSPTLSRTRERKSGRRREYDSRLTTTDM